MTTIAEKPSWLTVKQTAQRLDLHEITVRRKIKAGEISAHQLGGPGCALRVMEGDLRFWLADHRNTPQGSGEAT